MEQPDPRRRRRRSRRRSGGPEQARNDDSPRDAGPTDADQAIPLEDCRFDQFDLHPDLLKAIAECGYADPSPIQLGSIPHALTGRDIVGQARTGTGKTAAFLVPSLQRMSDKPGPRVLVVVPTRELAMQVNEEARRLGRYVKARPVAVYGGAPMGPQIDAVKGGAKVMAATPGRLLDLLRRRSFELTDLDVLVLDEADRMFDLGFRDDIAKIMDRAKGRKQTFLFSATMSDEVMALASKYMKDPEHVMLAPDKMTVEEVHQTCLLVPHDRKRELLIELLTQEAPEKSIVFTRTKIGADKLAIRLQKKGVKAQEIHGDLPQRKRERILQDFREGRFPYLIATDVAARGLDIDDVAHVINYDVPQNAEDYVHRVGRTARMGKTGRAATFVTPEDGPYLTAIEKLINEQIPVERVEKFLPPEPEEKDAKPKGPTYTRTLRSGYVRHKPRR